uniref:Solute carrier family 29 member 2 n=1 Tax=Neolamprologus brichardi TaxID=32507 RepID=A0A3Q4H3K3_NEOBR
FNSASEMNLFAQILLLLLLLLLVCSVRERVRVPFSLVGIFLLFSLTAALVKVPMEPDNFFAITMATIWFINMCGAVLQGSLFGMVGLFPARYSTLFMSGQGLAGIFAALAMLFSILGNSAALGYFITPCVATLGTLICYLLLPRLVWRHHIKPLSQKDMKMSDLEANGKLSKQEENQEPSSVLAVFKKIWLMALCVTCVFAVTLSVFPVITSTLCFLFLTDNVFTCVCCFIVFNVMDLPSKESRWFPAVVFSRLVFIPLVMLCNVQDSKLTAVFRHDSAFVVIMALFAFSNGYLASLCMAYAPQLVRCKDCETAGSLMTFFLVLGLAVGASLSFLLGKLV